MVAALATWEPVILPSPDTLETDIRAAGFLPLGHFVACPGGETGERRMLLVGSAGEAFARRFKESPERTDRLGHPLDRWTRRVLGNIAVAHGSRVIFPFDGPPWHPFQQWARLADPHFHPSPTGLLVHPIYGLWIGLRGAFFLDTAPENAVDVPIQSESPCMSCIDQPCLTACPVDAFDPVHGYDATTCRSHLASDDTRTCVEDGCLARHACPHGHAFRPPPSMARLHMRAFARLPQQEDDGEN